MTNPFGSERFPDFIDGQPNGSPVQDDDDLIIIRSNATKRVPAAEFATSLMPVLLVLVGATVNLIDVNQYVAVNKTVGSATTINLPATTAIGRFIMVADVKGDALPNAISVTPPGGVTIAGQAGAYVIGMPYEVHGFRYVATNLWMPE